MARIRRLVRERALLQRAARRGHRQMRPPRDVPVKALIAGVALVLALGACSNAHAADVNANVVTHVFTDTVLPAQQEAYEAGEKAWSQCLREHGFKYDVNARQHETGNAHVYVYRIGPYAWTDLDTMRPVMIACDAAFNSQASPHLQNETNSLFVDRPELSYLPASRRTQPEPRYLDVVHITLKQGHAADVAFATALMKIVAAESRSRWPHAHRTVEVRAGGEDAPDYVILVPLQSWNDYGSRSAARLWQMIEGVYGKGDAEALRKLFDDSIAKSSEHIEDHREDLGYTAAQQGPPRRSLQQAIAAPSQ